MGDAAVGLENVDEEGVVRGAADGREGFGGGHLATSLLNKGFSPAMRALAISQ